MSTASTAALLLTTMVSLQTYGGSPLLKRFDRGPGLAARAATAPVAPVSTRRAMPAGTVFLAPVVAATPPGEPSDATGPDEAPAESPGMLLAMNESSDLPPVVSRQDGSAVAEATNSWLAPPAEIEQDRHPAPPGRLSVPEIGASGMTHALVLVLGCVAVLSGIRRRRA